MEKKRQKITPCVYLYLEKNGKILLIKRANTGYEDGSYSFVAGHLEKGETLKEALARELEEEIGIKTNINDIQVVCVLNRQEKNNERIDFFMKTSNWRGVISNKELDKCDDVSWFDIDNIPENTIYYIKIAIEKIRAGIFYYEIKK